MSKVRKLLDDIQKECEGDTKKTRQVITELNKIEKEFGCENPGQGDGAGDPVKQTIREVNGERKKAGKPPVKLVKEDLKLFMENMRKKHSKEILARTEKKAQRIEELSEEIKQYWKFVGRDFREFVEKYEAVGSKK
jgi:cell division septum initiation protein DivIVA